jgi:hypothetical protein
VLSISSANLSSEPVGVNAVDVDQDFDGRHLVLDGDPLRNANVPRGSATIIRVRRDGALAVARSGIQDRPFTDDAAYLDSLRRRFGRSRQPCVDRAADHTQAQRQVLRPTHDARP